MWFDSSPFLEAKGRFASWASCSGWKAVLESSPEYVMVLAHAVRLQGMRVLCFRAVNPAAVLETIYRLQGQWPAGAKRSSPDRHATRRWLKIILIISV